ncbi:MAG: hypothetical protein LAP85_16485 [Acidobacteriia bacterium]|nr:hypothetical protein [Terriglobia bacterium]
MNKRNAASISPLILVGATLVRLVWFTLFQYLAGINLADLWHYCLLQLVIGG